jgi:hypothetical protein
MPFFPFFRLLVGAPRADARQPGVHKGGAVYKCPALRAGGCEIIPFDKGGKQHGSIRAAGLGDTVERGIKDEIF